MTAIEGHGGELFAHALRTRGVDTIYTLIGGHIFSLLDGAERAGLRIVDVRHESAAGFAAEGHAKLARSAGIAVVDAGPGVMNAVNTVASAASNGSPIVLVAGHPPRGLAGLGSLNETAQYPVFQPLAKRAVSIDSTDAIGRGVTDAIDVASARHRGPVYLEMTLDATLGAGTATLDVATPDAGDVDGDVERAAALLGEAERPVLFLGSDVWMDGAEAEARALAESQRIPVIMNGMARGVLPADHALAFSGARGTLLKGADVVIVAGAPIDFRLGYGGAFAQAKVVHLQDDGSRLARNLSPAVAASGPLADLLTGLGKASSRDRDAWIATARAAEEKRRAQYAAELASGVTPVHPARVYGELVPRLPRDAIVIADGGDFASYAGKYVDVYEPGGWLDPGPYGCLGTSAGYALAAGSLYPGRRVVVLLGDGAAGFSLADWDSLVRHGVNVTFVCGNNGAWGLEKQPMRLLYGREVAADLRAETRYDDVMRALGGDGELVRDPDAIGAAIERALSAEGPSLVNVITDAEIAYPRGAG